MKDLLILSMVTLASSAPQSLVDMEEKGRVAPACCVEDSNLVSAAIEGDLEKVMVKPNNTIFNYW